MQRKFLNAGLFIALIFAVALAQQPLSPSSASPDRLRAHVMYLASDSLEGRRTGSQGANDAAHYIAGEFTRYGLRPGMQLARAARTRGEAQARYLQPFPYVADVALGADNLLNVNPGRADDIANFQVRKDWIPLGFSSNGSVKGAEMVFAGYGISSAELKYDDYAGAAAKDRVAIVFAGTPDGDNPHGQFVDLGQVRFKAATARVAGARALLIIASEEKLGDDRLSRLSYDNAGEAGIPVIVISRNLAGRLLGTQDLAEVEKTADIRKADAGSALRRPSGLKLDLSVNVVRRESPSFNVIGVLPGSDPKLKNEAIVIGAHYDHLGRGGAGSLAAREGGIHHGADDNASGTAGLIELARMLSTQSPKPKRTIVLIAFSGEEEGLIGSSYYVNHPVVPLANTVAMINMDMVGRLREQKLSIGGVGTAQEWRAIIGRANANGQVGVDFPIRKDGSSSSGSGSANVSQNVSILLSANPKELFALTLNEDGYGPSDHSSFYSKQVPVLFFFTGNHEDYHKPSDTAEKINYEGEAGIVSMVARIIREIDKSDQRPTYTKAKSEAAGRSMGFRVYLGTIPNYGESSDGLMLDGVRDDSPAAKAGLKAGDKIVKMAGHDVKNVYDYTFVLGEMKAGQEYEVEVVRGTERLRLKLTPAARRQ